MLALKKKFQRPLEFYQNRFHEKQFEAWLAFRGGLDLVLPWGRRSGKTELICEIMIEDIEIHGHDCLFVAKTQKQAREIVWPKFEKALRNNPEWKLYESTLEVYHLPSCAVIKVKGVDKDADNLTGSGYRIIACDEYALWKKPDVVKRVLIPMLGDYNGQIIFTSTKRGKNHFYKRHMMAVGRPDKYFVSEATMFDNKFMTDEGRAKVLSEYDGENDPLYQQEVMNQYVSFEGMAFALAESDYIERIWDPADLEHSYHWQGIDHGYSPDPTACVWIAYNRRKKHFLVYSDYEEKQLLIKTHADAIKNQEPYLILDSFSDIDPQLIAEYEEVGLALTPAKKADKSARILRLVNHMRTGKLKIAVNCTKLLSELQSYEWDQDGNDHLIDALNYGYNNLTIPPEVLPPVRKNPRHVYKPNEQNNPGQNFGDEPEQSDIDNKYDNDDYY